MIEVDTTAIKSNKEAFWHFMKLPRVASPRPRALTKEQ
jgi:hypothetical protein